MRKVAAGEPQIVERHVVDREDGDRRTVLGTHVPERRAIRNREVLEPVPEELHELTHHAVPPQPFGNGEDEIGGRRALEHPAGETKPEDLRDQHRNRLAEHGGFCFDPADTPPDDTEAVDHGGVRVGTDQGIGITQGGAIGRLPRHDDAGEVFEVDLVHDTGVGRHDPKVVERILPPSQKRVPLPVARELELGVQRERVRLAEVIDLHRVIDRLERVDAPWIAPESPHAVAHRRQIDHGRHAREVLQQHASGRERNFFRRRGLHIPSRKRFDVGRLDKPSVLVTQQVFQQDLQRVRQPCNGGKASGLERRQAEHLHGPCPDRQGRARAERIHGRHGGKPSKFLIVPHRFRLPRRRRGSVEIAREFADNSAAKGSSLSP